MDNLGVHKVVGVEDAVKSVGASLLYLPSYSRDLNLIEQAFAMEGAIIVLSHEQWAVLEPLVEASTLTPRCRRNI